MSNHANDQYLETRVMSASPVELVGMLYEAARQAVREARRHLAAGEIAARARQITRVVDIVAELAGVAAAAVPASAPDRVPEVRESGCAAGYGAFLTAPEYAMASQSWSA